MWAALNGHLDAVEFLINRNCQLTHLDSNGKTAIDLAREENNSKVVELLGEYSNSLVP